MHIVTAPPFADRYLAVSSSTMDRLRSKPATSSSSATSGLVPICRTFSGQAGAHRASGPPPPSTGDDNAHG